MDAAKSVSSVLWVRVYSNLAATQKTGFAWLCDTDDRVAEHVQAEMLAALGVEGHS